MNKIARKSVDKVGGVLAGATASALFSLLWRAVANEEKAPEPDALDHRAREVLLAAVLHGALFSLVRATTERTIAKAGHRLSR